MEEGGKWCEAERNGLTKVNLEYRMVMNIDLLMRRGKYEKVVGDFNLSYFADRL